MASYHVIYVAVRPMGSGWVCRLGWVHEVETMDTLETSIQGGGMDVNGRHKH